MREREREIDCFCECLPSTVYPLSLCVSACVCVFLYLRSFLSLFLFLFLCFSISLSVCVCVRERERLFPISHKNSIWEKCNRWKHCSEMVTSSPFFNKVYCWQVVSIFFFLFPESLSFPLHQFHLNVHGVGVGSVHLQFEANFHVEGEPSYRRLSFITSLRLLPLQPLLFWLLLFWSLHCLFFFIHELLLLHLFQLLSLSSTLCICSFSRHLSWIRLSGRIYILPLQQSWLYRKLLTTSFGFCFFFLLQKIMGFEKRLNEQRLTELPAAHSDYLQEFHAWTKVVPISCV